MCIPTPPPPQLPAVRGMQQAEEFDNQRPMPGRKNTQKVKLLVDPDEYFLRTKKKPDPMGLFYGGGEGNSYTGGYGGGSGSSLRGPSLGSGGGDSGGSGGG